MSLGRLQGWNSSAAYQKLLKLSDAKNNIKRKHHRGNRELSLKEQIADCEHMLTGVFKVYQLAERQHNETIRIRAAILYAEIREFQINAQTIMGK